MLAPQNHPKEARRQSAAEALDLTSPVFVETYESVVHLVQAADGAPVCLFSVLDGERNFFKACRGTGGLRESPRAYSFCGHAILQPDLDQVFCIPDTHQDQRFHDNPLVTGQPGIRFYAGIPIRSPGGLPVGTLCLLDLSPRQLTSGMQELLMHGRRLLESQLQLVAETVRDPLTGLYNRRFLQDLLEREWRKSYRQLLPLSALVLDVDHFKKYNDHYGHGAGDQALVAVAEALNASCERPGDLAVRYGGEEFLILLPQTDLDGARVVSAKIMAAMAARRISHHGSPLGMLSLSVGGAVAIIWTSPEADFERLMLVADRALYVAKMEGRNRSHVVRLEPDLSEDRLPLAPQPA